MLDRHLRALAHGEGPRREDEQRRGAALGIDAVHDRKPPADLVSRDLEHAPLLVERARGDLGRMRVDGDRGQPLRRRDFGEMRAERRLVDGKIVVERQEHRGDDALGNPVHVSGHFGLRYGRARGYCSHSTRTWWSRITFAHLSDSARAKARNSSGVLPTTSKPWAESLPRTSGSASVLVNSACSRATISFGVPAGTSIPTQDCAANPGSVSATVGVSGSCGMRRALPIASALMRPAFTCGIACGAETNMTFTWPPTRSIIIGAPPL